MHAYADPLVHTIAGVASELESEFERLVVESSTLAFRVAYGVLRQREDAEDVAQEAFLRAHRHFSSLRDRRSFRAWLVRTTWRLALDRRRADKRRISRETEHGRSVATVTTADSAIEHERAQQVWKAIDHLPD